MVSLISQDSFNKTVTLFGKSTDTKPLIVFEFGGADIPIKNGSMFYEINTSDLYIYDEDIHDWIKQ